MASKKKAAEEQVERVGESGIEGSPALKVMLAEAVEKARAEGEAKAKQLEANMSQLLSVVEALQKQVAQAPQAQNRPGVRIARVTAVCGTCGQNVGVCGGARANHVMANIMPVSPEYARVFPGVRWNGVLYAGRCIIPKSCAMDIVAAVKNWELGERMLVHGREKVVDTGRPGKGLGTLMVYDTDLPWML